MVTRSMVKALRSRLQMRARINNLPTEILTMIFCLATQEWMNENFEYLNQDDPVTATALSHVCAQWRNMLLQTPTFWSEIDLILTGPLTNRRYSRATTWAKRSANVPLHIAIYDAIIDEEEYLSRTIRKPLFRTVITRLTQFLAPLMPRIHTLHVKVESHPAYNLAKALTDCLVKHGSKDVATRLEFCVDIDAPELDLPGLSRASSDHDLAPSEYKSLLGALRHIHLENVAVDWGYSVFSGLTSLGIEFPERSSWFPRPVDLARVLQANPTLRSLSLYGLRVLDGPIPPAVPLDHLETLFLDSMIAKELARVLPIISSSSSAIRMGITLDNHPDFVSAAQSFFTRTKVTVLHANGEWAVMDSTEEAISSILVPMSHLHTLVLEYCDITESVLPRFTPKCPGRHPPKVLWPALRDLRLSRCEVRPETVRALARIQTPRTLRLYEDERAAQARWTEDIRAQVERDLTEAGVTFVKTDERDAAVGRWDFILC